MEKRSPQSTGQNELETTVNAASSSISLDGTIGRSEKAQIDTA
ncbi:MAG: hypothetical protein AAFY72_13460 [Cyanobacteria bacterium J06649_4]